MTAMFTTRCLLFVAVSLLGLAVAMAGTYAVWRSTRNMDAAAAQMAREAEES